VKTHTLFVSDIPVFTTAKHSQRKLLELMELAGKEGRLAGQQRITVVEGTVKEVLESINLNFNETYRTPVNDRKILPERLAGGSWLDATEEEAAAAVIDPVHLISIILAEKRVAEEMCPIGVDVKSEVKDIIADCQGAYHVYRQLSSERFTFHT
jgi:hypothetical protein